MTDLFSQFIKDASVHSPFYPEDDDYLVREEDNKKIDLKDCSPVGHNGYRVDVWLKEHDEGFYCPRVWIGYSYYLEYKDGEIIDKTIYPKPDQEKIF